MYNCVGQFTDAKFVCEDSKICMNRLYILLSYLDFYDKYNVLYVCNIKLYSTSYIT